MVDKKWRGLLIQYVAGLSSALSSMSFGINVGWTSPYVPYLLSNSSDILTTKEQASWCAVMPFPGCLVGALIASFLADKIGRKYSILMMGPLVFFSFIGIGLTKHIWYISGLRFIIGIADGALFTLLPMYIGEIVNPNIRGFVSSSICLFYILGTLVINIIGHQMDIFTSSMVSAVVPALHMLIFVFMPESPYYYVKEKHYEKAKQSLKRLTGTNNVSKELSILQEAISGEESLVAKSKLTDMVTILSNRKASIIFLILVVTNKLSGKMVVMLYTVTIFQESGSTIDPTLSAITYNAVELVVVAITTFFIIDRFGKRMLILTSAGGCGITTLALAFYFFIKDFNYSLKETLDWLPITSLVLYNILFSIGLNYAPITYLSELFPTNIKPKALCVAEIVAACLSYISTLIYDVSLNLSQTMSVPFLIFSVICFLGLAFIIKFVPETKGKTLEQIQAFLIKKSQKESEENVNENF